jgi:drug/metabolite transporter (DMT)-like permease
MNRLTYLGLTLLCVAMIASGQILFKLAAEESKRAGDNLLAGWLTWSFLGALFIYGAATLLWVWVLRHLPLNVAYPFFALAFIIVPVLAHFFLNEPLSVRHLIGGALILAGVVVASQP